MARLSARSRAQRRRTADCRFHACPGRQLCPAPASRYATTACPSVPAESRSPSLSCDLESHLRSSGNPLMSTAPSVRSAALPGADRAEARQPRPGGTPPALGPARAVRALMPNRSAAARSLIPSIITACRTRAYSSTVFIPRPLPHQAKDSNCRSFAPAQPYKSAASVRDYCFGFYTML